jgi:hypothetical protein
VILACGSAFGYEEIGMLDFHLRNIGNVRQGLVARVKAYGLLAYKKAFPFCKYAGSAIIFAITVAYGNGVLWQSGNYDLIKKFVYEMGKEQNALLYEIRQSIARNLDSDKELRDIVSKKKDYEQLERNEMSIKLIVGLVRTEVDLRVKMGLEEMHRETLKQRYRALETGLARLEGREPRMNNLVDSKPLPAPTNLRVVSRPEP